MISFSAEVNTMVINCNGIVALVISLVSTREHHKPSFLVAEDNTKLLAIGLDKIENIVEVGELVGSQNGVIREANG